MAKDDDFGISSFLDGQSPPEQDLAETFGLSIEEMDEFMAKSEANSMSQQQQPIYNTLLGMNAEQMNTFLWDSEAEPLRDKQLKSKHDFQETELGTEGNVQSREKPSNVVDHAAVGEELRRILASTTEKVGNRYDNSSYDVSQQNVKSTNLAESSGRQSSEIQHLTGNQNDIASGNKISLGTGNDEAGNPDSLEWLTSFLAVKTPENASGSIQQRRLAPQEGSNKEFVGPRGRQLISQDVAGLSNRRSRSAKDSAGLNRQYDIRNDGSRFYGTVHDCTSFVTKLSQLRASEASFEDICNDIDILDLPLLDEEMASTFQRDETEAIKIPWTVTTSNSPISKRIAKDVKYMGQMSVILAEDLFNHLFQLSRRSFLQREERVHLELWTNFMGISDVSDIVNLEKQVKQVIKWMETTFVGSNLASLIQNLVISIDDSESIRYMMERAKELYIQDQIEMTPIGSLFSLLSAHRDVLESNKALAKKKKEVDENVKNMKAFLAHRRLQIPKGKLRKKATRDAKAVMAREKGMINTYAGTRWLIVGSGDAHYAYQCAVVKAANESEAYRKHEQDRMMHNLVYELVSLNAIMQSHEASGDVLPGELVGRRVELINKIDEEKLRQLPNPEYKLLCDVADTMSSLAKIRVRDMFERIGGSIPSRFRKVLLQTAEKVEKLRGVGNMEGMIVSDIATIRDCVERELLKNERSKELLEMKREQMRECQEVIRTALSTNLNIAS